MVLLQAKASGSNVKLHPLVILVLAPQRRISSFPVLTICFLHIYEEAGRVSLGTGSHWMFVPYFCWHWKNSSSFRHLQEWIRDTDIGPTFLAYLTEEGRTIRFVMKHNANARHAEPQDLSLCKGALNRLHQLGIKHGTVDKHNNILVLLVRDESVTLIDFACMADSSDNGGIA